MNETTKNGLLLRNLLEFFREKQNLEKVMRVVNGETRLSLRIIDWFVTNYSKRYFVVYNVPLDSGMQTGVFFSTDGDGDSDGDGKSNTTTETASAGLQENIPQTRFNVYNDYKLKLRAYSKRNFDPFCRWRRISIPCEILSSPTTENAAELTTTIGQLNFFKWAIKNRILEYIESHFEDIEVDMNQRNTVSKKRARGDSPTAPVDIHLSSSSSSSSSTIATAETTASKTRKRREELSISACRSVKKENVQIIVRFSDKPRNSTLPPSLSPVPRVDPITN